MKKILIYIIIGIGALTAVSHFVGTPEHRGMRLAAVPAAEHDDGQRAPQHTNSAALAEELKYYFDRHDVSDEGYEMVAAFAAGQRLVVEPSPAVTALSVGTWRGHRREGTVVSLDSAGCTVVATWQADTIERGIRTDSAGIYVGDFSNLKAHGHGAFYRPDGSYAEGHWENDRQQGFGIELLTPRDEDPRLRVGEWIGGRFQGERMKYTSERIYGIDIAKYQHGRGRRALPIRWDQLRIIHVGRKGAGNVSGGQADYPISFVYIKSTEGTTIRNRFYVNDYAQARKRGIPVGAYHFWSVRTGGTQQAQHFIRNTLFRTGDLPPVLDIEPTDALIRQTGGEEKLFREVRIWLNTVERFTGVKPILYVNQKFVNNHLSKQADLKRDYRVWIARYSEYKPDVRLTYWQLCPDGRVRGITGDVDINVFNGYKSQFEEFLENETIKRR